MYAIRSYYDSYLKWPDIKTLVESGRVEIGNHSNKMHSIDSKRKASTINEGETYKDYLMEFGSDTRNNFV